MSCAERERLEGLQLLIEPSPDQQQEMAELTATLSERFERRREQRQAAAFDVDAVDRDPDCLAARMSLQARELYDATVKREERNCYLAQQRYQKQFKERNKLGL